MIRMFKLMPLAPLALLAACSPSDNESGPGGVSVGEARALDEAAEMIEERRLPESALEPGSDAAKQAAPPPPSAEQ